MLPRCPHNDPLWLPLESRHRAARLGTLVAVGGAGLDRWREAGFEGWDEAVHSPRTEHSAEPDRIILTISGGYGPDVAVWALATLDTVALIRERYSVAQQIVLQPVGGGPGHMTCERDQGNVRASWQHAHIDAAIQMVVEGDVIAAASPEVLDCSDYSDTLGHLTPEGAAALGRVLGEFYSR